MNKTYTTKRKYKLPRPYVDVGARLQALREAAGLTQRFVSLQLGYSSAQFISNFERGIATPPAPRLKKLFKLYGMKIDAQRDLLNAIAAADRNILFQKAGWNFALTLKAVSNG